MPTLYYVVVAVFTSESVHQAYRILIIDIFRKKMHKKDCGEYSCWTVLLPKQIDEIGQLMAVQIMWQVLMN